MNPADPSTIPLRDIQLPEAIGWWPPAPGWWLLAALLLSGVLGAAWLFWRRRRSRLHSAALAELAAIERDYADHGDGHRCARRLSGLARRLALAFAPERSAAATGTQWLGILEQLSGQPLPPQLSPVLLEAPYSRERAADLEADAYTATLAHLRGWLEARRKPPRTAVDHA